jgi:uncharacterized protein (DUF427 family)
VSDYAGLKTKTVEVPGPDHPITIERNAHRIVVTVAGRVVADTQDALTLREASYAPVQYIPRKDVDLTLLERTDHATYCPYKGDCAYFSIHRDGSPQRWVAPARPTTWTRPTEPRSGWRRATSRPQRFPEGTSFARSSGIRTRQRRMSNGRICCSNCAAGFQARL